MTKEIELKTSGAEPLTQLLPLASDQLTVATLQNAAAALVVDDKSFSLRYTDSDGDEVTIAHDADVKELADYMADEQLERVTVLVTPQKPRAMQTRLRGLVAAMSKLTTAKPKKPTAANAMNLLVASLQTMDVAEDSDELAAVKKELLGVLQDEEFKKVVEELSASEEFKELADVMVAVIYEENAQAIEETATARFEELLRFAQNVVACCPAVKPAMINVAKQCMSGLVRLNDEELEDDDSDASSIDSLVEEMKGFAAQGFEAQETPVHFGIICDGCEQNPLVGVRYKSLEVADFDLCEDCEASGKWMTHEPFIKISDPSRAPKQKRPSEVLIHTFVVCDGCEMSPIVGTRFKSKTADDFDLCEKCEASGKWTKSHGPFAKIDEPGTMKFICRRGGKFGDHGKFGRHHGKFDRHGHHCHHGKFGRHGHHHGPPGTPFHCHPPRHHGPPDFFGPPHHEGPGFPGHGLPHYDGPRDFPPPPPRREDSREFGGRDRSYFHGHRYGPPPPPPFPEFDRRWRHGPPGFGPPGCFGRFGPPPFGFEGPHGAPPCPPGPQEFGPRGWRSFCGRHGHFPGDQEEQQEDDFPRSHHGCRRGDGCSGGASDLGARFLEDVTIEDGTVAEAGKPLRKMWKLLNDGERSWPDGCYMISKDDNPLLPGRPEESRIDLPALAPGEEFIATMDLLAPTQPGRYTSFWRVCDPAGASFGHRFWIDIVVAGNTAAETTPSEASTMDSTEDSEVKDVVEVSTPADAQSESDSDDDIEIIEAEDARSEQLTEMHKAFVEEQLRDAEMMEKYDQLESMGFADPGENLRALELADGDIGAAVNILLSE